MQLAVVLLSALGTVTLASPAFGRFGSIPDTPQRTNEAFAASPELNGTSDSTREERPAREIEGVDVLLAFQHQLAKDMEVMEAQGHGHLVKRSTVRPLPYILDSGPVANFRAEARAQAGSHLDLQGH